MNPIREYMSAAILISILQRKNEPYDHLWESMTKAREALGSRSTVAAADKRIRQAVQELLDGASPPSPATMDRGATAVDIDLTAVELVDSYRRDLESWGREAWHAPVIRDMRVRAATAARSAKARAQAKAATRAEEVARNGVPFDLDAGDGPALKWLGGWRDGRDYKVGAVVSRSDSLWVCEAVCHGVEPGKERGGPDEPRAWRVLLARPDLRPAARDRRR